MRRRIPTRPGIPRQRSGPRGDAPTRPGEGPSPGATAESARYAAVVAVVRLQQIEHDDPRRQDQTEPHDGAKLRRAPQPEPARGRQKEDGGEGKDAMVSDRRMEEVDDERLFALISGR